MRNLIFLISVQLFFSCQSKKKETVVTNYYGYKIEDAYRALEAISDTSSVIYANNQNKLSSKVLTNLPNLKDLINKQVLYDQNREYVIKNLIITDNDYIFYLKRLTKENVAKLYYKHGINGTEKELYDPSNYNKSLKSEYQINYIQPNWEATKVVVSLNKNEEELSEMLVLDVNSNSESNSVIRNCAPSALNGVQWIDNKSFLYAHLNTTDLKNKNLFYDTETHLYNTDKNISKSVFSKKNNPNLKITSADIPLIEIINSSTKYALGIVAGATPYFDAYLKPIVELDKPSKKWKSLFRKERKIKKYDIENGTLFYLTGELTKNFRICSTSVNSPNFENPVELVPEKENEVIKYFKNTKKGLFYTTVFNGVKAKLYCLNLGIEKEIKLPKPSGDIKLYKKGEKLIVAIKGWLNKTERYIFNFETNAFEAYTVFADRNQVKFDDLIVEEITVPSHDGAEVPLSLVYKKGTKRDGNTPVLMRAYGAYGQSMVPNAYYPFLLYAREGGIYALAHVRGGGEKGEAWYNGGYKTTKPNSWKDFIACTEFLIKNQYTSKAKIAIWGGSAGGIVIGRAITERPDLYSAAIIDRGMLNTLRIEEGVNGANSAKEFGSVKDSIGFIGLLEMDAFHSIKKNKKYPATLVRTGLNDKRVPPWHSFKFAARLSEENSSKKPILLKTESDSGHGLHFTKNKEFAMIAESLSFALWQTGHPDYQLKE